MIFRFYVFIMIFISIFMDIILQFFFINNYFSSVIMDNQAGVFNSEPLFEDDRESSQEQSSSCPISPVFGFIILFNWKDGNSKPFRMYPRTVLPEIGDYFIDRNLPGSFRLRRLRPLKHLPGETLSLFAKVDQSKHFFIIIITISKKKCIYTTETLQSF